MNPRLKICLAVLLGLVCWLPAPGAMALGGAISGADGGLSSHVVMVLSRQGNQHGACTGTVIARDIIVTAAHCVAGKTSVVVAYPENGSHVLQRVTARAINPGFSKAARVSLDLAVLKLEGQLPSRFRPVRIDRGSGIHSVGNAQRIAGYGMQAEGDDQSAGTLRSARVEVLPRLFPRFLRLGVNGNLSELAICTGDSGGPVFETGAGEPLLVGVVYGREKLGDAKSCGVTAQAVRIAPQRAWIDGVVAKWMGQAPRQPRSAAR